MKKLQGNMDKKLKKHFLGALRSERYTQGHGCLHDERDNSFCCLAVLAVCAGKDHKSLYEGSTLDNVDMLHVFGSDEETNFALQGKMIDLNDEKGWSFKRIATWAEKHL